MSKQVDKLSVQSIKDAKELEPKVFKKIKQLNYYTLKDFQKYTNKFENNVFKLSDYTHPFWKDLYILKLPNQFREEIIQRNIDIKN